VLEKIEAGEKHFVRALRFGLISVPSNGPITDDVDSGSDGLNRASRKNPRKAATTDIEMRFRKVINDVLYESDCSLSLASQLTYDQQ
jgi:hypothetical protein